MIENDPVTGLWTFRTFQTQVSKEIERNPKGAADGEFAICYCDVLRFKMVNDMFGVEEGDKLLKFMALLWKEYAGEEGEACRVEADRFVVFVHKKGEELEQMIKDYLKALSTYPIPYEIICNIGVFVTTGERMSVRAMVDRAIIAHASAKGDFLNRYNFYSESQRDAILSEQEIVGMMIAALEEKQFVVYYQPQYDHTNHMLVGSEALVRWIHPKRGLISPAKFVPIFEKNGFITKVDMYVFESVCEFQCRCMVNGTPIVPISVNVSRRDIYQKDFVENLEEIRRKYDVPVEYIRLEITESAVIGGPQYISEVLDQLHKYGYVVEMDDFGSAYSSLNVLKSVPFDILKLDMGFLSEEGDQKNGGIIVSSVIRMAKWLGFPVIAEGVEIPEQADYLQSIGCRYIQGYLYAKPMPESEYTALLFESDTGKTIPPMSLIDTMNAYDFWNPTSLETLIFSNYVGGAAIFEYRNGKIEVLRANKKYVSEINNILREKDIIEDDPMRFFDEKNHRIYMEMIERAIASGEEEECETWRTYEGYDPVCLRSNARMIGKSADAYLFYGMIRNITAEKKAMEELMHREKLFRAASEQANIYYWEYDVKTKDMVPCFRCRRDLHFPTVMQNYPEPAIEMGVFPPEVADSYRQFMKRIENGEADIEMDIPLTEDRVMFHVHYTTEFDEEGKPVKAYGSAIPV